ncbi:citR protein [Latilactobacillus sakei subsp. carnosus DSM 15831]|uniref:GntR family transcriptional regulator n=1 Tax=Latilactobacillus sakei TaxID=1599 RepID=UPI00019CEDA7|nr:GntR family transcriptional regulator [Latilactobacillus sakei]KRL70485.1 citR protein [Latilactobacillus sakei subsp. carnosus DSM 15831]GEP22115.1 transcriptional regulator [Latilactobacillus sakei subsp. carnosus]
MDKIVNAVAKNLDLSQNRPIKELIYEALRKTVILGDIPAGVRINEKYFSEMMNISRTPIRYALKRLADEDLVIRKPGIGVIVKGISVKDAYEIYAIRKELDALATRQAMRLMTTAEFEQLNQSLLETRRLNEAGDVTAVLQKFSEFNQFIYDKSQMYRLKSIVVELQEYLVYFRDICIRSTDRCDLALAEHWLIYRGMLNQDINQINLITHEHLNHSLDFIVKEMRHRHLE